MMNMLGKGVGKMKKIVLTVSVLVCVFLMFGLAVGASGESTEPSLEIVGGNLSFEDSVALMYAVSSTGVEADKVEMLYWTAPQGDLSLYTKSTETYSSSPIDDEVVNEKECKVFRYEYLWAKEMTDYIYARAYISVDGQEYYSSVIKYSVLQYAYNMLGYTAGGSDDETLHKVLNNMLEYGAAVQEYKNYRTDRLATDTYYQVKVVGGKLEDGFTTGLYNTSETATLTAPAVSGDYGFTRWVNSKGEEVSCDNLLVINEFTANETYTAVYDIALFSEGLEYTVIDDTTCYVSGLGTCADTDIVIPSTAPDGRTVIEIGYRSFAEKTTITSVIIPDSVTYIYGPAFYGCTGLTSVKIGNNVTSIGSCAFEGCTGLTSVIIPNSVISIDSGAFKGCTGLTSVTIGNSVTSIGSSAFSGCTGLTSFEIGNSVTSIGRYAFSGCTGLTSVTIGNSVTSIGDYAFENCTGLTSVEIGNSVTSIGSAFYNCTGLTAVYIEDLAAWCNISFYSNYSNPLYYAKNLYLNGEEISGDIVIPEGATQIGKDAFYYCDLITSVEIPDTVISIGSEAFSRCTGLTSVTIGNGVESIGSQAFQYCTGLTSVTIGNGVESIGSYAFTNCTGLISITVSENNLFYKSIDGNLYTKDGKTLVQYAIGKEDTSFTIPDTVTSIGSYAFSYCTGLTSVVIPDSVTSIGSNAFYSCDGLTSVTIGNGVTSIGYCAFYKCTSLTDVYYTGTETEWNAITVGSSNTPLTNATKHYNYTPDN